MEYSQIAAAQSQIDAEIDLADLHEGIKQEIIDECEEIIAAMEQKKNARWVTLVNEVLDMNIEDWITEQISGGKAFGDQLRDYMFYGMYINHRVLMDEILLLADWESLIESRIDAENDKAEAIIEDHYDSMREG